MIKEQKKSITTKMVSVFLTSRCSLNCKYCGALVPKFRELKINFDVNVEKTKKSIDELFSVYSYINHLDFTGGEPLLKQNELIELLKCAAKYKNQFDFLRVLTNGTILPSPEMIATIKNFDFKFDFYLDNYKGLSVKADEFKKVCAENNIEYKEIIYSNDAQYCDGWIDFGDLEYKNYSKEQFQHTYDSCLQAHHKCLSLFDGVLYPCSVAPLAAKLNKFPVSYCGGVDLNSKETTLEEKRIAVMEFGDKIIEACNYCNGFDYKNAPRFPAAEQA